MQSWGRPRTFVRLTIAFVGPGGVLRQNVPGSSSRARRQQFDDATFRPDHNGLHGNNDPTQMR